jgi:hypothetical protein
MERPIESESLRRKLLQDHPELRGVLDILDDV